jgi:hypothetical protein
MEDNEVKPQITATIEMADTRLTWSDDDSLKWSSVDGLTGASIKGTIEDAEDRLKFYASVFIALAGEDQILDQEQYKELEQLLGFTGENQKHPARWIP